MVRLKIRGSLCGSNFNYVPGDEADWEDEEDAARLVAAGHAEYLGRPRERKDRASTADSDDAPDDSPAANPQSETAAPNAGKAKRGRKKS